MDGLMMDFQLTLPTLLRRVETYFGDKQVITRLPDKSFHRYAYRDMTRRAKQLAVALRGLGLEPGDRVATLCWNHYQHLEAYFGIPCGGFVLHTLNLRLHPNDIGYVAAHAGDRVLKSGAPSRSRRRRSSPGRSCRTSAAASRRSASRPAHRPGAG